MSVYPGLLAWWPCATTAVLLWTGQASISGGVATWLSFRPLRYIGDISYSLYLWHYVWLMLPLQMVHPPTSSWAREIEVAGAFALRGDLVSLLGEPDSSFEATRPRRRRGRVDAVDLRRTLVGRDAVGRTSGARHLTTLSDRCTSPIRA